MSGIDGGAAVIGIGMTPVRQHSGRTALGLAADALTEAVSDSGITREDIDGFALNLGRPNGEDYDRLTEALGLRTRFTMQTWTHGRFTGPVMAAAAMAVLNGLADVVACVGGMKREGDIAIAYPGHKLNGMGHFTVVGAMTLQRYLHLFLFVQC
jgi:acetyl-CoA acetyltransferase